MSKFIVSFFCFAFYLYSSSGRVFSNDNLSPTLESRTETAYIRTAKFKLEKKVVLLEDLIPQSMNQECYDGKWFAIIFNNDGINKPLCFNKNLALSPEQNKIRLRASTVYYHLTKARKYYLNLIKKHSIHHSIKKSHFLTHTKIIIRIDMPYPFNEFFYFDYTQANNFNNALSIPASGPMAELHWGPEIWFRPKKEIFIADLIKEQGGSASNLEQERLKLILKEFKNRGISITLRNLVQRFREIQYQTSGSEFNQTIINAGLSLALFEVIVFAAPKITGWFSPKSFWLDTALTPEIIYHEYSHQVFSPSLGLFQSTPVNEGIADYFASRIGDHPHLATKLRSISKGLSGKKGDKEKFYRPDFELNQSADQDFVFSLLWTLGSEVITHDSLELILLRQVPSMSSFTQIRSGLIQSLQDGCKELCNAPMTDLMKMNLYLHKLGI